MKENECFNKSFGSRRKRKAAVKAVISLLDDIRRAERGALDNTPENFQSTESFDAGESAVDALEEAMALLADVYQAV